MNHKLHCQVPESHIVLINLFCTPKAAAKIVKENPKVSDKACYFISNDFADDFTHHGTPRSDSKPFWRALFWHG